MANKKTDNRQQDNNIMQENDELLRDIEDSEKIFKTANEFSEYVISRKNTLLSATATRVIHRNYNNLFKSASTLDELTASMKADELLIDLLKTQYKTLLTGIEENKCLIIAGMVTDIYELLLLEENSLLTNLKVRELNGTAAEENREIITDEAFVFTHNDISERLYALFAAIVEYNHFYNLSVKLKPIESEIIEYRVRKILKPIRDKAQEEKEKISTLDKEEQRKARETLTKSMEQAEKDAYKKALETLREEFKSMQGIDFIKKWDNIINQPKQRRADRNQKQEDLIVLKTKKVSVSEYPIGAQISEFFSPERKPPRAALPGDQLKLIFEGDYSPIKETAKNIKMSAKGKKNTNIQYDYWYDDASTATDINNGYDLFVQNAVANLFYNNQKIVTLNMIYKAMGNTNDPDSDNRDKLLRSLLNQVNVRLFLNDYELSVNWALERSKITLGYLLPVKIEKEFFMVNGMVADLKITILDAPPLIELGQRTGQRTTIPQEVYYAPAPKSYKKSNTYYEVKAFLFRELPKIESGHRVNKINYSTFYTATSAPTKHKDRYKDMLFALLELYKELNYISSYKDDYNKNTEEWGVKIYFKKNKPAKETPESDKI